MVKFPYVGDYKLFERVEIAVAEEILSEYNDFFIYNQSQVADIHRRGNDTQVPTDDDGEIIDENEQELRRQKVESVAIASHEHFTSLFGSKDFAESCFCGLKILWYDMQQILLEEYRSRTPIQQSAMNTIAPRLRAIASTLLFAEYIINKLERLESNGNEMATRILPPAKERFLELLQNADAVVPEYHKAKNNLAKLKTVEKIVEYCDLNLFIAG